MKNWFFLGLAAVVSFPAIITVLMAPALYKTDAVVAAFIYGLGVIGAAFILSWACEVAQLDIPAPLALSVLALIAVLPEYAVDFSLTYQAATDPAYEKLAVANMIGANRMIVGFAWPLIIFLFWIRFGKREVTLEKTQRVEIGYLGLAGLYSLIIPVKGRIDLYDVGILVLLFVLYTVRISRSAVSEPHLIGPAEAIGRMPRGTRLSFVAVMLLFAGGVIFLAAHPFAESLIRVGTALGVGEVFMVQWFAPLASEAPEIVVCVLFTVQGMASAGLGTLVASKVNQWTLLVGTLPLVYLLGKVNDNRPLSQGIAGIPLSPEQVGSMFVTSGQTLLAVAIMLNLRAHLWEAGMLFFLLVSQFFFPSSIAGIDTHYLFGTTYMVLFFIMILPQVRELGSTFKTMFNFKRQTVVGPAGAEEQEQSYVMERGQAK